MADSRALVDLDRRCEGAARSLPMGALGVADALDPALQVVWRVADENMPMKELCQQVAGEPIDAIQVQGRTYCTYVC